MTAENNILKARNLGQSIWLDSISRDMLRSGELKKLVEMGVGGVTSNPSIFEKAIAESDTYDESLAQLLREKQISERTARGLARNPQLMVSRAGKMRPTRVALQ